MKFGKWGILCGVALVVLVVSTGCARQRLAMVDARSEPAELSPGDESIICVRVIDTQGVVAAVTATVREYSAISLDLNDSGEEWMERHGLLERSKE